MNLWTDKTHRETLLTADTGSRALLEVIHVLHCLHARARGILGKGRVLELLDRGGTGSRRRGDDSWGEYSSSVFMVGTFARTVQPGG